MSCALPPSKQPDSDNNINNALPLARYNEEIEQNIRNIKDEQVPYHGESTKIFLSPPPPLELLIVSKMLMPLPLYT